MKPVTKIALLIHGAICLVTTGLLYLVHGYHIANLLTLLGAESKAVKFLEAKSADGSCTHVFFKILK